MGDLARGLSGGADNGFRLLREGLQCLDVAMSICDDDFRLIECNRRFQEIFDLPDEMAAVGAPLEPILVLLAERGAYGDVEPRAFAQSALKTLRGIDAPFLFERCVLDGRIFESHTSRLSSGGYVTIHTEITHHKLAEARLLESARALAETTSELELILRNASLGILIVVPAENGRRVMRRVNLALERMLGYEHGELEGQGTRILYPDDGQYDTVSAGYANIVCSGLTYQGEHFFQRKNGQTMVGILRGSAINPDDLQRGAIWLIEDITERKRIAAELAAKEALLQTGTDNMAGAMVIWDQDLRYLYWTPRAEYYFSLPPGTLRVGLPMQSMARYFAERGDFGDGDIDALIEQQMRPFYRRESMVIERQMPNGTILEVRRNPLPDGGYVSVFQDITERKSMEKALLRAKIEAEESAEIISRKSEQLAILLNNSGQGFLSFGQDLIIDSEYSQACVAMLGCVPAGENIARLLFAGDTERSSLLQSVVRRVLSEPEPLERAFWLFQLPEECQCGDRVLKAEFRALENGHMMTILTDVTDERKFRNLSMTDRLTGLFNRRKLDEVLEYEHERAGRTHLPMALIMVDVDRFKAVNDEHGHQNGDRVLVEVAAILQRGVRKVDTVGRWGGEEFMILCSDTGLVGALELAEKLRRAVENHQFPLVGRVTCSFGVAELHWGDLAESLVRKADDALYQAKNAGRNRVGKAVSAGGE